MIGFLSVMVDYQNIVVCLFSINNHYDEFHLDLCTLFKSESQIQFHKSVISVVSTRALPLIRPMYQLKLS